MKEFYSGLSGLRFIAIISVALLHLGTAFLDYSPFFQRSIIDESSYFRKIQLTGADGVLLFFGLSGFLITNAFFKKNNAQYDWFSFISRRIKRIYPPYIVSLVFFFVVQYYFSEYNFSELIYSFIFSMFFLHDIKFEVWSKINPVAWSLEIEVQFYFLVAYLVFMVSKLRSSRLLQCIVATVLVFLMFSVTYGLTRSFLIYFNYFIAGVLASFCYYYLGRGKFKSSIYGDVFFIFSLLAFFYLDNVFFKSVLLFIVIIFSFKVFYLRGFFSSAIVSYVSKVSYSYYLIHYPMFHLLMILFSKYFSFGVYWLDFFSLAMIFIPLTFILTFPFYFLFERNHEFKVGIFCYYSNLFNQSKSKL